MKYTFNLFLGFFLLGGLCFTANPVNGKEPIKEPRLGVNIVDSGVSAQADFGLRILNRTIIRTNATVRTASCVNSGCIATATAFLPNSFSTTCPTSATSNTCTIVLTFCGQFTPGVESLGDDNLAVRFLIDGVRANPGPTDANGFVSLMAPAPIDSLNETRCFSVTDTGNTAGLHNVNVQFAVEDLFGDGANVSLGFAHLLIQVFKP